MFAIAFAVHAARGDYCVEVTIYDSKYNGELPPSLTHQLAIIYKQFADNDDDETFLNLNVPNVQQQTGVDDCGLFAIAFAVHAARGDCVGELDFDQAKMRSHVIKCFSQKKMLPFPIIESKYCTSIKRHMFFPGRQIELFCECRMPETYDNMIQCDQCCTSLAVPPLRLERKGLGNVAYTTCTLWNADLVIRRSLLKSVIIFNFYNKINYC